MTQTTFIDPSSTVPAADGGNTGNGTMSMPIVSSATLTEAITVTCTVPGGAGVGQFSVSGSVSGALGTATSDVEFVDADQKLRFTLNAGATPWAVGDEFTLSTTAGTPMSEANIVDILTALVNKGFVVSGFTFPPFSATLSFNIAAGVAFLFGYRVEIDTATTINCTDNTGNYIFLKLIRTGGNVTGAAFEVNTTNIAPPDSIPIALAQALGGQLPIVMGGIIDISPKNPIAFKDGDLQINGTISFTSVASGLLPFSLIGYSLLVTTQNFGSIAAGTTASVTLGSTGAAFGDFVLVSLSAAIPTGLIVHAYVESPGNIKLCLSNVSAAAIDPPAITFNIRLYR